MPIFSPMAVLRSDSKYSRTTCTLRIRIEPRLSIEQNLVIYDQVCLYSKKIPLVGVAKV